jgi:hypothetical protein
MRTSVEERGPIDAIGGDNLGIPFDVPAPAQLQDVL